MAFKATVAVAAIKAEKTMIALAQDFDVPPNRITQWRDHLLAGATGVFGEARNAESEPTIDVKTLHAEIGELTLEKDFVSGALGPRRVCCRPQSAGHDVRRALRRLTVSENRTGPFRYTEFQTLPSEVDLGVAVLAGHPASGRSRVRIGRADLLWGCRVRADHPDHPPPAHPLPSAGSSSSKHGPWRPLPASQCATLGAVNSHQ